MFEELMGEDGLCGLVFGNDHQSGSVLVDAVYQISELVLHRLVGLLEMPCQSVKQGPLEVAMARVDYQSRLFVDDDEVGVFIDDIQRYFLGRDVDLAGWVAEYDGYDVARLYLVVRLHCLFVDEDVACLGSVLHAVARDVLDVVGQEGVDALLGLAFVYHDTDMLV